MYEIRPDDPAVHVEYRMADGDPASGILRAAREGKCDLIVMGTHGRGWVGRLLMGSVAQEVVRKAPCPVLTVKMPWAVQEVPEKPAVEEPVGAGHGS